jgi:hypothetical protein
MEFNPIIIGLPIADRLTSFNFYRNALGLAPIGEPVEDGVPEPLQFAVNEGLRLMLVPVGGFGWVIGDNNVAERGFSECILSMEAATESDVDEIVRSAVNAGGKVVNEPAQQAWGYTGGFSDPDGHIWTVVST